MCCWLSMQLVGLAVGAGWGLQAQQPLQARPHPLPSLCSPMSNLVRSQRSASCS